MTHPPGRDLDALVATAMGLRTGPGNLCDEDAEPLRCLEFHPEDDPGGCSHLDKGGRWADCSSRIGEPPPYSSDTAEGWAAMKEMVEWAGAKGFDVEMYFSEHPKGEWSFDVWFVCEYTIRETSTESLPHALSLAMVSATGA